VEGSPARAAAASIVERVAEEHQPLAAVLDAFAAGEGTSLAERDAALARAIARVAIRRRGDIDWCLSALMERPLPRRARAVRSALRVAAAQILFMRQAEHAAVNTAVSLMKADQATAGFSGLANAILRRLAREGGDLLARLPAQANTPAWLWRRWCAHYGGDAAEAMAEVHRQEPALDIAFARPVPLPEGASPLPTGGARLPLGAVTAIEGYAEGTFWVQDMAAQLPALLLGDVSSLTVLDMCAAPGGKTMQLAARGARVTAVEIDPDRAARLAENLARTRLADRVEVVVADALAVEGTWDAVLLDAPCTATGTLRRQPDAAWAKSERDLKPLANLQRDLLRKAASLVAPGGRLVYATCSLEPEEGEEQIAFVGGALPSLELLPVADPVAAAYATPEGVLRTLPHLAISGTALAGLDGFFAACFRRS